MKGAHPLFTIYHSRPGGEIAAIKKEAFRGNIFKNEEEIHYKENNRKETHITNYFPSLSNPAM